MPTASERLRLDDESKSSAGPNVRRASRRIATDAGTPPNQIMTTHSNTDTASTILGSSVSRREDPALLTGEANFTDDIDPGETAHLAILRSPYAHARI